MEEEVIDPEIKAAIASIMEIISRLLTDYNLFTKEIAEKIGETEDSFYRYARGEFPLTKPEKIRSILKKLQNLEKLEKDKLYPTIEGSSKVGEKENELIIIYFPDNLKKEPYRGYIKKAGATTEQNGAAGIIAYPNDSSHHEDADGLVPMNDPSADSVIPCGRLIAIKKIEIRHCRSGYRYYFFDHAKQPYLRKLHIDAGGKFKLLSDNPDKFDDITFSPAEIAVAFRVLVVSYKFYD